MHDLIVTQLGELTVTEGFKRFEEEGRDIAQVISQLEVLTKGPIDVYCCAVPVSVMGEYGGRIPCPQNFYNDDKPVRTNISGIQIQDHNDGLAIAIYFSGSPLLAEMGYKKLYAFNPQEKLSRLGVPFWTTYYRFFNLNGRKALVWTHLVQPEVKIEREYEYLMRQGIMRQAQWK